MMEKQNTTVEKKAAGDAGDLDDIVDAAANKLDVNAKARKRGGPQENA